LEFVERRIAMTTLATLILICGGLHLCLLIAGAMVPRVLDWRRTLAPLDPLSRQIIWIHGAFIVFNIVGIAAVSVTQAGALAGGSTLARSICGFVAFFWGVRLMLQLLVVDARHHLTTWFRTAGYHALTLLFATFTVVYGWAAFAT
jgi:hypothetical protein